MKTCRTCGQAKPAEDFYRRSDGRLRGSCKPCWSNATRAWQRANPERVQAYGRTQRARLSRRERTLRDHFGMTMADYDAMWEAQGRMCPICRGRSGDEITHVDHCHHTGRVRAILCGLCNRMLGQAKDDAEVLRRGADYLDQHRLGSVI